MISILLKDLHKDISTEKYIEILSELFRNGMALDLADTTNDDSYISSASAAALSCIDLEELFDNSELLEIEEKYPEFYNFLREWYLGHHRDNDGDEKLLTDDDVNLEETLEELTEEGESVKGSVVKNLVEGEHTGDQRFSEKYVKGDKFRDELTEDYNEKMKSSKFVQDSYGATGQQELNPKKKPSKYIEDNESKSLKGEESKGLKKEKTDKSLTVPIGQKNDKGTDKNKGKEKQPKVIGGSPVLSENIGDDAQASKTDVQSPQNMSGSIDKQVSESEHGAIGKQVPESKHGFIDKQSPESKNKFAEKQVSRSTPGNRTQTQQQLQSKDGSNEKTDSKLTQRKYTQDSYGAAGTSEFKDALKERKADKNRYFSGLPGKSEGNPTVDKVVTKDSAAKTVIGNYYGKNDKLKVIGSPKLSKNNVITPELVATLRSQPIENIADRRFIRDSYENVNNHGIYGASKTDIKNGSISTNEDILSTKAGNILKPTGDAGGPLQSPQKVSVISNQMPSTKETLTSHDIIKSGAARDLDLTEHEVQLFSNVSGYIPDSYEQVNFSFGFRNIKNECVVGGDKVNIGTFSRQAGNIVPIIVNGRAKQFTIRSDGTINVNGVLMNVYTHKENDSGKVFVGWKNAVLTNGNQVCTPGGLKFNIDNGIVKTDFGVDLTINNNDSVRDKVKVNAFSYAPTIIMPAITGDDFKKYDSLFATKDYGLSNQICLTNHNLNYKNMEQILTNQNKHRYISSKSKAMQSVAEFANYIQAENVNYDEILKEIHNSKKSVKAAILNRYLENTYLDTTDITRLAVAREKLREFKKEGITDNAEELRSLLNTGAVSQKARAASEEYIKIYDETRLKIIKQNLDDIKNGNIDVSSNEYKFFAVVASTEEKTVLKQTGHNDALQAIKDPLVSDNVKNYLQKSIEYKKAEENLKRLYRTKAVMNAAKNTVSGVAIVSANNVQKTYKKGKQYASRYMSDDYTTRGLLILTSVIIDAPVKAYSMIQKSRSIAKSTAKLYKATVKSSKALGRTAIAVGKTGKKGAKYVAKHGAKKAVKTTVKVIGSKARRVITKQAAVVTKKVAITIVRVIIKILSVIVTTLLSILGPVVLALLVVIILIFSIFAFLSNSGDDVYYDAGDEDTTEVVQEMNDLLTLCHASFRSQLSGHSGVGGGMIGGSISGTDGSSLNAPQMKKGDSSAVSGLYDVTTGTWWNYEFSWDYISGRWAAGTRQAALGNMIDSGQLKAGNNGGYLFLNDKLYVAAFGSYWGQVGDVLKVEFNNVFQIGTQPATNTMYIVKADEKAWRDTGYPEQPEGIYGHPFGGHRDFAEFIGASGVTNSSNMNLNSKGLLPMKCTNLGNVLDGTCDLSQLSPGGGGMSTSVSSSADIFYRQEIDQEVYREILDRNKNIYTTFPKDQEVPDGITPTPTPVGYDPQNEEGEVYSFYNNNQELISMVLAMFDFDINSSTSAKQTTILTSDKSGTDDAVAEDANQKGMTNKINDDTWRLITYFDEFGLDLETYNEGGYDDLKYSALVGLFNASHIVTDTPVLQYHEGPDGTINPVYDENGKIVGQNNTDGHSYQVPVIVTEVVQVENPDGSISHEVRTAYKRDENGNIVYETKYDPCLGHRKDSIAVITLHFDSLLHIKDWWNENIYSVDDFDEENPNYSSNDEDAENYKAKDTVLKRQFQFIMKPDFYKPLPGTCSESNQSNSEFNAGTMSEDQKQVANKCYQYFVGEMGLTHEQAIGVLVNIKRECDFNYTLVENGGGGYGLVQWTGGRRTKLMEYCNSHPETGSYNTLEGQLAFLNAEFTIYNNVWTGQGVDGFRRCKTEREAGEYFIRYFERPREDLMNQRIQEMDSDIAAVKAMLG